MLEIMAAKILITQLAYLPFCRFAKTTEQGERQAEYSESKYNFALFVVISSGLPWLWNILYCEQKWFTGRCRFWKYICDG